MSRIHTQRTAQVANCDEHLTDERWTHQTRAKREMAVKLWDLGGVDTTCGGLVTLSSTSRSLLMPFHLLNTLLVVLWAWGLVVLGVPSARSQSPPFAIPNLWRVECTNTL